MSKRQRLLFTIGCWVALVTAGVHLAGQLSGHPPPANETERQLRTLVDTYRFALPGAKRTYAEFMTGFSLTFTLFLAFFGTINLLVVRRASDDSALMRAVTWLDVGCLAGTLVISLGYFFLIPSAFMALVTLIFVAALF